MTMTEQDKEECFDYSHPVKAVKACLPYYSSAHRTDGCKISHMIGVPMIFASTIIFPFNKMRSAQLMIAGWILQFIGHSVFERNKPLLLEIKSPFLLIASLIFVSRLWIKVLLRRELWSSGLCAQLIMSSWYRKNTFWYCANLSKRVTWWIDISARRKDIAYNRTV